MNNSNVLKSNVRQEGTNIIIELENNDVISFNSLELDTTAREFVSRLLKSSYAIVYGDSSYGYIIGNEKLDIDIDTVLGKDRLTFSLYRDYKPWRGHIIVRRLK